MPESVYIHIPFCKSKCRYCSFVSYTRLNLITPYIDALLNEINEKYKGESLKTLYFGGGTPSLIPTGLLERVINKFNFAEDAEITLELNPDDAGVIYFQNLLALGINRLSVGSQTFDDRILKLIGRRHNSRQILDAVKLAKEAGFENISVDLIYGLPSQTLEGLKKDLEMFIKLDIQHISTYGLKIEEESFWGKYYKKVNNQLIPSSQPSPTRVEGGASLPECKNSLILPTDDMQADMYELVNEVLENNGFYRYEISNFSKPGFESRHNLNYWNNNEYYGFGAAAHGYQDGMRCSNFTEIEKYIDTPCIYEYSHVLTGQEKLEEEIFLGFRKTEGINVQKINKIYGIDFESKYKKILQKYSEYFIRTPKGFRLSLNGVLLSNLILSEFI